MKNMFLDAAVAACCAVLAFAPVRASCRVRVLHGADAIIQIRPNLKDLKSQKERYHRNIVIERNRFETPRIPLLRACSVSNLVWRGNEVNYNDAFPRVARSRS